VADVDRASYRELAAASILLVDVARGRFSTRATALLAQWPQAELVATRADQGTVWLADRQSLLSASTSEPPPGFDPTQLASLVFVRRTQGRDLTAADKLRVGNDVTEVVIRAS
jgi:hypothetical protein